jgi:hypothetical protein
MRKSHVVGLLALVVLAACKAEASSKFFYEVRITP